MLTGIALCCVIPLPNMDICMHFNMPYERATLWTFGKYVIPPQSMVTYTSFNHISKSIAHFGMNGPVSCANTAEHGYINKYTTVVSKSWLSLGYNDSSICRRSRSCPHTWMGYWLLIMIVQEIRSKYRQVHCHKINTQHHNTNTNTVKNLYAFWCKMNAPRSTSELFSNISNLVIENVLSHRQPIPKRSNGIKHTNYS